MKQMDNDTASVLDAFDFYRNAPPEIQQKMVETALHRRLEEGTYYFHETDTSDQVGLVVSGIIRVFRTSQTGREITLFHVQPGQACILNVLSVLTGFKYPATSLADGAVEAILLPGAEFRKWVEASTQLRNHVYRLIGLRFTTLVDLVDEITFRRMDSRLASLLLTQFSRQEGGHRDLSMTHEALAHQLGSAREVIGRLLKDFEEAGAISRSRGSIHLEDEVRLRQYCQTQSTAASLDRSEG